MRPSRFLLCIVALLLFASTLLGQTHIKIRVENANARKAPDSTAKVLTVLHRDQTYPVKKDVPYYYGIRLDDGRTAYVAKSLCTVMAEADETESGDETGQSLAELYELPAPGNTVTLPNCTPADVPADWDMCSAEGSGGMNRLANLEKNRLQIACSYTVKTFDEIANLKNLPRGVRSLDANDPKLTYLTKLESQPVVFEGYLAMAKNGGEESTNCDSKDRTDIHMETQGTDTGDPKDARGKVVVTEMTPWFMERNHSWTLDTVSQYAAYRPGYKGTMQHAAAKVRIYGWLFFDNWHSGDGSIGTWRGTAWEIHPITRIEVWEKGAWKVIE
jgi:hypothetical protein